ncbi:MAG: ABC transporter ATP-binding protein [Spirochaetales bacterium]
MITLSAIRRTYEDFELDVSLSVSDSEIVTLLGPSGSGKTTTLRIVAGFEYADTGALYIDDTEISRRPARLRDIGYVFQDFTLFPHLNVAENIAYGLRAHRVPRHTRESRVNHLLDLIGLNGFGGRNVATLSGGEQQRVAVARALARQPKALLLDEPFSAVDSERREELLEYVLRIQRELRIPTLFVTHSRADAFAISDRIAIMRNGSIDNAGAPPVLYHNPGSAYTARLLGGAFFLDARQSRCVRPEYIEMRATDPPPASGRSQDLDTAAAVDRTGTGESGVESAPTDSEIAGRVRRSVFRGALNEYRVETRFGDIPVLAEKRFAVDERVSLFIPSKSVMVLGE